MDVDYRKMLLGKFNDLEKHILKGNFFYKSDILEGVYAVRDIVLEREINWECISYDYFESLVNKRIREYSSDYKIIGTYVLYGIEISLANVYIFILNIGNAKVKKLNMGNNC